MLPHPFLQLQCCFQRSLEGEGDRVRTEHDARPAFLALDFLARLRSTVPYVRRQLHLRALHHVALPVRLQRRYAFWCQPPRRCQTAQERHPHMHTQGTELFLSVCALCFGLALDCASGFVVEPTCLCHCFGHALSAWNQVRLEHGGGQLSQFCRVDQRQSSQHVHQAPSDISSFFPLLPPPVSPLDAPALAAPPPTCACPRKASRSPSFLKTSHKCSWRF